MSLRNLIVVFFLLLGISISSGCKSYYGVSVGNLGETKIRSRADLAKVLADRKRYDEAIDQYSKHITDRLAVTNRPPDENPYFYYLLIGDLYIRKGQNEDARKAYKIASQTEVNDKLVLDRFRLLAKAYSLKGKYQEAIDALQPYRDLDPLLVDSDIDQYHRKMIHAEDQSSYLSNVDTNKNYTVPASFKPR